MTTPGGARFSLRVHRGSFLLKYVSRDYVKYCLYRYVLPQGHIMAFRFFLAGNILTKHMQMVLFYGHFLPLLFLWTKSGR